MLRRAIVGLGVLIGLLLLSTWLRLRSEIEVARTLQASVDKTNKHNAVANHWIALLDLRLAVADDLLKVVVTNRGSRNIRLLEPELWYSISLDFYDSGGSVIIPDTLIALELPPPTESYACELSPGASVDFEYSLERLREIIDFGRAKFAVAKYSIDDVDFRLFPNAGLDVGPGFRLSNVVAIR